MQLLMQSLLARRLDKGVKSERSSLLRQVAPGARSRFQRAGGRVTDGSISFRCRISSVSFLLAACIVSAIELGFLAAPGVVDTTFSADGIQTVDFGFDDRARAVVVQPDGKIIAAGSTTFNNDFVIARLNPDGTLDASFSPAGVDGDGLLRFTFGGIDVAQAVALQPDGKIIVAGYTNNPGTNDFAVARINADGTEDATFDVDGEVTISFGGDDRATGVVVQDDGKIVVVGSTTSNNDFAIARLNANGSLDLTFNGTGLQSPTFGAVDVAQAVALQADGKIVVAGYTSSGASGVNTNNFAVTRISADGTQDASFDVDGEVTIDFTGDDRAAGVAVRPTGEIVVGGTFDGGSANFAVVQLSSAGALDLSFSADGKVVESLGAVDFATGLALQHNGKVVLGGHTTAGGGVGATNFGAIVFNRDGTPDTGFSGDGETIVDLGGTEQALGLALQPDGQLILAGFGDIGGGVGANNFALLRLGADPPLDLTFDSDGRETADLGGTDQGNAMVVQPDGKIVVVGSTTSNNDFAILRLNPNGSPDTTFDADGEITPTFGAVDIAQAVALQPDGKIVVAGYTSATGVGANDFAVTRLNTNGTQDVTFDVDGEVTVDFGFDDRATGVAVQLDGKIVVSGSDIGGGPGGFGDFALARLNPDGSLDTSFSGDGLFSFTLGGADFAQAVALQPDGKIVLAGYTDAVGGINGFAVARINADGTQDATFDVDGERIVDFGADDRAMGVVVQTDGKIVAAGFRDGGTSDFALLRLNADGSSDATFSGDGQSTASFGQADFGQAVALQPNGKLVVAGYSNANAASLGANDFALTVLNTDGTIDTAFNDDGRLIIDFGNDDRAMGVAVQPADGKIVAAGYTTRGNDFAVLRLPGDTPPALPSLSVNDVIVAEGPGGPVAVTFTVTLSAAVPFPVTVDVAAAAGSATAGSDYTAVGSTPLLFLPGVTTRTVLVPVTADAADEPNETFTLNLSNAGNATIADAQGLATIRDDDLTVTITSPTTDPTLAATTSFVTLGGTASDAIGIAGVAWATDRGFSGAATGTTAWTAANVPLLAGANVITVTATDANAFTATDTLTVTVGSLDYYLAEGATGTFFDYDLLLGNPNAVPAPVTIDFLRDDGVTVTDMRVLPATSRTTIRVDDLAGLGATALSTVVHSTAALPLMVERSMYWDANYYGGHAGSSVAQPAANWVFAEGSQGFFDTYVLLANANGAPANVTVRFLLEAGAPVVKNYVVNPTSRFNVYAGGIPELVGQSFSIVVESSLPIIAERAMYFGSPLFNGGHESAGVTTPSTTWFHAEGATGSFFDTYILIGNSNAGAATVTLTYLLDTGATVTRVKVIPGNTRLTVNLEDEAPELANAAVSTTVTSDLPVVSERAMYWSGGFNTWFEAHNSFGVTSTATKWGLAEGRTGGPFNFQTYILLANPSTTTAANVQITYLKTDGTTVVKNYVVNPTSRYNVDVNFFVPELAGQQFAALIEVTNGIPIAVERALYNDSGGVMWAAGTNATAVRLP